jgi:hypothetical protein
MVGVAPTVGLGFTVTVAVVVLEQPPAEAVMLNTALCTVFVLFVNVPEIVEPEPFAAMPVRLVVFVLLQVKEVPDTLFGFDITIFVMATPEQIV